MTVPPPAPFAPPVFVYGALRSGTTVFRLMLNAHTDIGNPGEVDFLFDYIAPDPEHPTGWCYDLTGLQENRVFNARSLDLLGDLDGLDLLQNFMDQLARREPGVVFTLNVHRHADRILQIFPEAKFIHLLRDPRDVARSSVGMGWVGISYYGVDHWIRTERAWSTAAVPPEQTLTLRFENLMAEIDTELARVCDFLGVSFRAAMLTYHHNTTYGPPDPSLSQQWRRKATPYEISLLEGKCADLMTARGYKTFSKPCIPGGRARMVLQVRNDFGRWKSSVRRYGLPLLASAKLSKLVGLENLHRRLRRRMADKITQNIK